MWLELGAASFLLGRFIYRGLVDDDEKTKVQRADQVAIPQTEEGGAIPLLFGRCRVNRPVLGWIDRPHAYAGAGAVAGKTVYSMSMLFVIGIPMANASSTNKIHGMWCGDLKFSAHNVGTGSPPFVVLGDLDGNGDFEDVNRHQCSVQAVVYSDSEASVYMGGAVEFLNGNPDQLVVEAVDPYTNKTRAGVQMTITTGTTEAHLQGEVPKSEVPGYRGYLSAFLYGIQATHNNLHFNYGLSPQLGAFSFEVSSYNDTHSQLGTYARIGQDLNPINALFDVLVASIGKLGLSESMIDMDSFKAAQLRLHNESHGYSRCFEDRRPASEVIREILEQIDGVLYVEPRTGKIHVKLVRNDFTPSALIEINRSNCQKLVNGAAGGWTSIVNKVRVVYTSREKDYTDDSEVAHNQGNAASGDVDEEVIHYPGVTTAELARQLANRELAARSRPLMKCTAYVDRSLIRVRPGDAVRVSWKDADIANIVFRVAQVDHGTLEDGTIILDLIQDFNYTYAGRTPKLPPNIVIENPPVDTELG